MSDTAESIQTAHNEVAETNMQSELTVGELLCKTRESKKLSIDQVATALRIGPKQITSMENNAFHELPDAMIARGFLRNYAKFLGLDSEPLISKMKSIQPDTEKKSISMSSANIVMSEDQQKSMMPYVWSSVLVLVSLLLWYIYVEWMPLIHSQLDSAKSAVQEMAAPLTDETSPSKTDSSAKIAVQSVGAPEQKVPDSDRPMIPSAVVQVDTSQSSTTPTDKSSALAVASEPTIPATVDTQPISNTALTNVKPAETKQVSSSAKSLEVICQETTWVHIKDANGLVIFDRVLPAGAHEVISGQSPFGVVIGNAPATTLKYGQDTIDLSAYTKIRVARLTLE